MVGNCLGVDRLNLLTHTQGQVVVLAAFKAFAVSADPVKQVTRKELQVIDIHQGPEQLRTVVGLVHAADQKPVGIDLNLV